MNLSKIKRKSFSFIIIYIMIYYLFIFTYQGNKALLTIGGNIFQTLAPAISSLGLFLVFKKNKTEERKFWFLLSTGILSYFFAMLFWNYYEIVLKVTPPFPGIPDLLWILMNTIYLFTGFYKIYKINNLYKALLSAIGILISISVITTFSLEFLVAPIFYKFQNQSPLFLLVYMGYPISNLGLMIGVFLIYFNSKSETIKRSSLIITSAFFIYFIANSAYLYLLVNNMYYTGSVFDPLWSLAMMLMALGGINSLSAAEEVIEDRENNSQVKKVTRLIIVTGPYIALFILMIVTLVYGGKILSIGLAITIVLVMIRQIIMAIENKELLNNLSKLNSELEDKVNVRTKELEESNKCYKELFEKNAYMANHDVLTGLPNRRYVQEKIEEALYDKNKKYNLTAIMFIDLDRFKAVNDNLGHDIGDELLIQVSNRLKACIRRDDIAARQGGDEFIVLVRNISSIEDVENLAQRIVKEINKPFFIRKHEIDIGCSIGISVYPDDGDNAAVIMKNADLAMYRVKEKGKNGYQFY